MHPHGTSERGKERFGQSQEVFDLPYSRIRIQMFSSKNYSFISGHNNIHAKISPCWLAESMSINLKQCRKLKLSAKSWNWEQKVEIVCKNLKLNWLTGKSRKRISQSFVFKSSAGPGWCNFSLIAQPSRTTGSCNFVCLKKFTRALYLFQIALDIIWLPIRML